MTVEIASKTGPEMESDTLLKVSSQGRPEPVVVAKAEAGSQRLAVISDAFRRLMVFLILIKITPLVLKFAE